jgi:hypothetical protein
MPDMPLLERPTEPVTMRRQWVGVRPFVLLLLLLVVFAFLPGPFGRYDRTALIGLVISLVLTNVARPRTITLAPDGITTPYRVLPWSSVTRIEVLAGIGSWSVTVFQGPHRTPLIAPAADRCGLSRSDPRFDAAVVEVRRWAAAYAPRAEVVSRRHGPAALIDLLQVAAFGVVALLTWSLEAAWSMA